MDYVKLVHLRMTHFHEVLFNKKSAAVVQPIFFVL